MTCLSFLLREIVKSQSLKLSKKYPFQVIYTTNYLLHNMLFQFMCYCLPNILI